MKRVKKADGSVVEVDEKYSLTDGESFVEDKKDITASLEQMATALKTVNDKSDAQFAALNKTLASLLQKPETEKHEIGANVTAKVMDEGWARQIKARHTSWKDEDVRFCRGVADYVKFGSFGLQNALNNGDLKLSVLVEGTATLGGVLVPEQFDLDVIQVTEKYSDLLKYINFKVTNTDTVNLAGLASGPTAYVVGENAATTASNPVYTAQASTLVSIKMIAEEVTTSRQLLTDAVGVSENLSSVMGEARAKLLESEIISGSTLCTGFMSLSNPQVQAADHANLAYSPLNALVGKIYPALRSQAIWVFHPDKMTGVRGIASTQNVPIFQQMQDSPVGKIFGMPVIESYNMPSSPASGVNFAALLIPSKVIWAYRRAGMSLEVITSGTDSASNNLNTNYLATIYLRERLGVCNYAALDIDGENHVLGVLQQG